jgi:hypothetical protein
MGLTIRRNLGPVSHLEPSEYTLETASGRPALACPSCGGISDLELDVFDDGTVAGRWACPFESCPLVDYLHLEAWREEVVPPPRAEALP